MTDPEQAGELEKLREQVMELTQRIFRLEQILEGGASASFSQDAVHYPTMQLDSLPEPSHFGSPLAVTEPGPAPFEPELLEPTPPPAFVTEPPAVELPLAERPATDLREARPAPKPQMSLESRIGGQWLNRIGIIAVLVGLSYFLKLAFDYNWIGPPVRVGIGLAVGLGLLWWSERFRTRGFAGFAYSLKAIGFGAMYLSLWAAFQFYHLIPATVAFAAMVAVTVLAAALSLRQNSELLAAFALVGGFLTPVLVSSNENREAELLAYLALLDLATIWIVAIKGWRRILLASLIGTMLLFGAWASVYYTEPQLPLTLEFASFFFALYALAPLLGKQGANGKHPAVVIALALLNAAGYFAAGYEMLFQYYREEFAWLTAGIAVFFFVLFLVIRSSKSIKPLLAPLYLGLSVVFVTIAIPLKLDGYWITLGWIIEAGALFWASHLGHRMMLRILGVLTLGLGVSRLVMLESDVREPLLINPRFGLYLLAIAALAMLISFAIRERGAADRQWAGGAIIAINLLALIALHFEVVGYFQPQLNAFGLPSEQQRSVATVFAFTYSAIWMIYGSALTLIGFWKRSAFLRWQAIILLLLTIGKVFLFDVSTLERGYRIAAFIVLGTILLAVSYFYQRSRMKTAV